MADRRNEALIPTDTYRRDKGRLVHWLAATLGAGVLWWGIWATNAIFDARQASAVQATAQQSIATQLARIEASLAEIQRDLRYGRSHP